MMNELTRIEELEERERQRNAAIKEVIGMLQYGSPQMALRTLKDLVSAKD